MWSSIHQNLKFACLGDSVCLVEIQIDGTLITYTDYNPAEYLTEWFSIDCVHNRIFLYQGPKTDKTTKTGLPPDSHNSYELKYFSFGSFSQYMCAQ